MNLFSEITRCDVKIQPPDGARGRRIAHDEIRVSDRAIRRELGRGICSCAFGTSGVAMKMFVDAVYAGVASHAYATAIIVAATLTTTTVINACEGRVRHLARS
jgi:hypothetical protein